MLPEFSDVNIKAYLSQSGKKAASSRTMSRATSTVVRQTSIWPEARGYTFFLEGYLHNIWSHQHSDCHSLLFKANCFVSIRKTDNPRSLWARISLQPPYNVPQGLCSCKAGQGGFCNHLVTLLFQVSHYSKSQLSTIQEEQSKTSQPQTWHKPRAEGIQAEPVMDTTVKEPRLLRRGVCNVACKKPD